MSFQKQLRQQMDARDWRPVQLAAALDTAGYPVTTQTIYAWLDGIAEPRINTARGLASVFEMSMDDLYPAQPAPAGGAS
jgi:DNA-binding XRE family transcriptional regulator